MPPNGKGYFSLETEGAKTIYQNYGGEKYAVNEENQTAYATDVKRDENGMMFTLNLKGEEPIECHTVLLGTHSVKNICLASAVAKDLGLTKEEIRTGISRIKAIGHRLELVPNNKGIVIIDDSYNSNQDGASAAMEVLSSFEGRKIVLTPGLVELGKEENVANFNFGKTLAKHADKVIVIGKHNAEMIINGLIEGGMNRENISFCKTLNKGNELLNETLREGDVVLFENDLPDNYS
jgi:UDP-N-acetylmuramoyl-tripeptide--D-alanyl-D-alanine ligase